MKKMSYEEIKEFYEEYKKYFDKCNLTPSILWDLQERGTISVTVTEKNKNYKVVSEKKEDLSLLEFMNCVSWIEFFHDRVSKRYTKFGYIVDEMKCISPDGKRHIVRTFAYGK